MITRALVVKNHDETNMLNTDFYHFNWEYYD